MSRFSIKRPGTGLTSQQVKDSYAKCGCETSAEAGTEPSQACQHHKGQRDQWQQKLAPPQVYKYIQEHTHEAGMSLEASQLLTILCWTENGTLIGVNVLFNMTYWSLLMHNDEKRLIFFFFCIFMVSFKKIKLIELTGAHQVLSAIVVSWFFIFRSELLR